MTSPPKPNTQALSWFYGEQKNHSLRLSPKYQRNPIWSIGQKCFLIDSIISACPIPQIFLNIVIESAGSKRKTYYDVVDGQQRLRAILEYMNDEYPLIATTPKSYPVSDKYKPHIGKKFSELPSHVQNEIWDYQIAVQEIRGWEEKEIRALFRRLNYVFEKLNQQEMRHSQYFGEFVNAVETLSNDSFWDEIQFFSRRDSQRMKDIEFISELFILLIKGPQEQKSLDNFYAEYDVEFPRKKFYMQRFRAILMAIGEISDVIRNTRFSKKADFYGLFGAIISNSSTASVIDLKNKVTALQDFSKNLDGNLENLSGDLAKYHSTIIEGANKLPKRLLRIEIIQKLIS